MPDLPSTVAPILSVRGLSKVYGARRSLFGRGGGPALTAVDDVSLDLYPGENLGIVGESGSGKTTLGRLMLRVVEPSAGSITYRPAGGEPIAVSTLGKAALKRFHADVRLVFQDPFASLNPRMTVKQIVGDPFYIRGLASGRALEEKVADLLEQVGLDPASMERYPHAFSGGQRQRIGIARALALDPRIIVADEATSALDVSIRSQILDLLLDIQQRRGLSFVFISHDISVVHYFCNRVAVMRRGTHRRDRRRRHDLPAAGASLHAGIDLGRPQPRPASQANDAPGALPARAGRAVTRPVRQPALPFPRSTYAVERLPGTPND